MPAPLTLTVNGESRRTTATTVADLVRELGGDPEKIEKGRGQFDRGNLAVAVIASPKPSEKIPPVEQLLSAGALCMNIVHAATAAGWGACWLSGWDSPRISLFFTSCFSLSAWQCQLFQLQR